MAGFQSMKWAGCVNDYVGHCREKKHKGATFLIAAVAVDMARYADANGVLFRSEEDAAAAVCAAVSNVREARRFLQDHGLMEVSDVPKTVGNPHRRGRKATTFRLIMKSDFRPHTGGNSACMGAENEGGITAPNPAGISACMGAPKDKRTDKGTQGPQGPVSRSITSDSVIDDQKDNDRVSDPGDLDTRGRVPSPDPETYPSHFEPDPDDVAGAARTCWQFLVRRQEDQARSFWTEHRRELARRASVGYSDDAIDRMLVGYKEAVRYEIAHLRAAARQAADRGET